MRTMLNSLKIILNIRNTVTVNSILHGIRSIPVIGKHIPEQIYSIRIFKIIALILSVIREVLNAFFGKLFLFAGLLGAALLASAMNEFSKETVFLYGFLLVSLSVTLIYNVFKNTPEGDYSVFMMGMDAKKYVTAKFFYDSFNVVLGYTVFGIPAALFSGVKWYLAILLPVAGVGFKIAPLGLKMSVYSIKQSLGKVKNKKGVPVSIEGNPVVNALILTALIFAGIGLGIWVVFKDYYIYLAIVYVLAVLSVIPGLLLMKRFPFEFYRSALSGEKVRSEILQKRENKRKTGNSDVSVNEYEGSKSNKKGYGYLHDLFIKRHQGIIWKRQIWGIASVAVTIALLSILLYYEVKIFGKPEESFVRALVSDHQGVTVFVLWMINTGAYMAHAMFAGCDSSMLVYGFYRTPSALQKMYRLRIMSVFKYNMIPSVLMLIFYIAAIIFSGGENYFGEYFFLAVTVISFTFLFSMRNMTFLYLIQPYSSNFAIKSKLYTFQLWVVGFVLFVLMFFRISAFVTGVVGLIISVIYFLLSDKLVYKFAPRTFRIK